MQWNHGRGRGNHGAAGDHFDRQVSVGMAVLFTMAVVEQFGQRFGRAKVIDLFRDDHRYFVALPLVPEIHGVDYRYAVAVGGDPGIRQDGQPLGRHVLEDDPDFVPADGVQPGHEGPGEIEGDRGGNQPHGRSAAGAGWHNDALHAQGPGQFVGVGRSGSAKGE